MSMNRELCPSMKTSPNDTPTGAIDIDNSNIWKKIDGTPCWSYNSTTKKFQLSLKMTQMMALRKKIGFLLLDNWK